MWNSGVRQARPQVRGKWGKINKLGLGRREVGFEAGV